MATRADLVGAARHDGFLGESKAAIAEWGELELGVPLRLVDPSNSFYVCGDLRIGPIKVEKSHLEAFMSLGS